MDFITLLIIGFVIYSLVGSVGKSVQKGPGKEAAAGKPAHNSETKQPRSFWEMLEEWADESTAGSGRVNRPKSPFPPKTDHWEKQEGELRPERGRSQSRQIQSSMREESTEGIQGVEGRAGVEGTLGTEGIGSFSSLPMKDQKKEAKNQQAGNASPIFQPTDSELVQGIIWAEVLGKPRALKPFRGPRN